MSDWTQIALESRFPPCHNVPVPASKAALPHLSRLIHQRVTFSVGTGRKLTELARLFGLHYNPTGHLLDLLVDVMKDSAEKAKIKPQKGYGSIAPATIRIIRRSKDKIAVIAIETGVSEAMVSKIRSRLRYKWVK